jgi:hypothetical protein
LVLNANTKHSTHDFKTASPAVNGEKERNMSALLSSIEHAFASAASDVVKVAKFVGQSVLPALKKAQAEAPTIAAVTALVSPAGGQY